MALTLVSYTRVVGLCFLAPFWLQHHWPTFSEELAFTCAVLVSFQSLRVSGGNHSIL